MLSKYFSSKIFLGISFFVSLLSLTLFSFIKIPSLFPSLQGDMQKNFIFILLGLISSLSFFTYLILKKEINSPDSGLVTFLYLLVPIAMILSTIFSASFTNSFFGKFISSSNLVFVSSLILSVYIISSYLKNNYERWSWVTIIVSSLLLTLPVIIAIILFNFNLTNIAPYFTYFIGSWDVVAVVAAIVIVISLVYFETIAFSAKQRFISLALIIVHLILITFIIIPDLWFALAFSSLAILVISVVFKKSDNKKIYNRLSFYLFIVALFFSIIFSLANSWGKAGTVVKNIGTFSQKHSGINYSFIKPQFRLSYNLGVAGLKKGEVFGAGLNEFNNVWQKEKPQTILESSYWDTEFISSYSAMTTLFVTVGIFGVLAILAIIFSLVFGLVKNIKRKVKNSDQSTDDENKFYFLVSTALFVFSVALLFLFVNTQLAIVIFALSSALLSTHLLTFKEMKMSESVYIVFFIALLIILSGSVISINRERAAKIVASSTANFQKDNNSEKMEADLIKAAKITNDDTNYRLLTQFYLYKTQQLLSASSTDTTELQKQVLASLNNAIASSKTAISIDSNDYNNYMSLGSIYAFWMGLDKENKEQYYKNAKDVYTQALTVYPKNPTILLTLAQLEYSYSQDSTATINSIQKSLDLKPNYSAAYSMLSQLASQNNDREGALKYATQAVQADPNSVDAYIQFGILSLGTKTPTKEDLSNAYFAFSTVLQADSSNLTAAYYLAITFTLAKDYANANALADSLLKSLPDEEKIKELKTYIATEQGKSSTQTTTTTK